jgi:hypothetical protein
MASETYEFLKNISMGKEHDYRWSYPDPLIYDIVAKNPGSSSKVVITFDKDDDFLDILGIDEYDRHGWNDAFSDYHDRDTWNEQEEWTEGYILQRFNEVNRELVNEIIKLTNPALGYDFNNNEDLQELAKYLKTAFDDEIDLIIGEYGERDDDCRRRGFSEMIIDETKNPFKKFGVMEVSHGYKFETTVAILLTLYRMVKTDDVDLKGLLTLVFEKFIDTPFSSWSDKHYDNYCDDFDEEGLQKEITYQLEKILDNINEDSESYADFNEYNELYYTVKKLGGFEKMIDFPDKKIQVIFTGLDPQTNELEFKYYTPSGSMEKRSVKSIDELNLSLYQPELFESIKRIQNLLV